MGNAIFIFFYLNIQNQISFFFTKSISKSGIEILSGFKNLSKIRLNLIGSTSVISNDHATNDPAPDPRPGPTGILFFLAHLI